ncbi:MAG: peptidase S8 [Anaerolinea sp.]|nr:peptidase S8 [Anaerolinea sp.]
MFTIRFAAAFAALLAVVVALPAMTSSSPANAAQAIPGSYIVVLKDGADADAESAKAAKDHGAVIDHVYRSALNGYAFRGSAKAAAALSKNPNVQFVSEDRAVEAIGKPGEGPSASATQSLPTGVNRIDADASSTLAGNGTGSVNVGVAVIDTGSGPHSDLNIAGGKNCSTGTSYNDGNGHGTHVAGTIGARDNTAGVVGVAPGTPIYSVRVLNNQGSGSWSSVICGIDWVAANATAKNIKVANMSLGGTGSVSGTCATTTDAMRKAICNATNNKGVTFVVAAGNSGADLNTFVPAAYPEVLTVTAISDSNGVGGQAGPAPTCRAGELDEAPATFSNYATTAGALAHTIAAPGVCILSTWKGGGYATISGTSMASPHVAGVVALCLAKATGGCAGMTPPNIIGKVRTDAQAHGELFTNPGKQYGYLAWAGGY